MVYGIAAAMRCAHASDNNGKGDNGSPSFSRTPAEQERQAAGRVGVFPPPNNGK